MPSKMSNRYFKVATAPDLTVAANSANSGELVLTGLDMGSVTSVTVTYGAGSTITVTSGFFTSQNATTVKITSAPLEGETVTAVSARNSLGDGDSLTGLSVVVAA